ncbi:uncharacterized protein MYCGRDRAFT_104703 [Zymoseptoria tritici IPO323]|uniref:Uncharacterized protein n=1 Tax=Zymoseptoria tritici (strain CBS 115943 / IPO323) TaxID=336722 RepID=F9XE50_ZYMTI|nr:uncharacterized protein MYCGRDRAFT_104703 [Zymoseptoria tritici IPO323]EGP86310.1 hypothetical protein MYCGRDRAFT_104703 [Zymoseptoria tritici IPO323]
MASFTLAYRHAAISRTLAAGTHGFIAARPPPSPAFFAASRGAFKSALLPLRVSGFSTTGTQRKEKEKWTPWFHDQAMKVWETEFEMTRNTIKDPENQEREIALIRRSVK